MEIHIGLAEGFLLGPGAQPLPGQLVQEAKPTFRVFHVEEDIRVRACKQQGIAGIELAAQALAKLRGKILFGCGRFWSHGHIVTKWDGRRKRYTPYSSHAIINCARTGLTAVSWSSGNKKTQYRPIPGWWLYVGCQGLGERVLALPTTARFVHRASIKSRTKTTEKMKKTNLLLTIAAASLLVGTSQGTRAATFTVTPDNVNRLNGFSTEQDTSTSDFSTRQQDTNHQYTILTTSTASFNAALLANLGPLGAGQSYQINSATLTAGSSVDDYTVLSSAHLMITAYDPGDATWNEADNSANTVWGTGSTIDQTGGTDWVSAAIDTGVLASAFSVSWSNFGTTVQGWVDGGSNPGLFFEDISVLPFVGGSPGHQTSGSNVVWTLDAVIIPEPSRALLLGLAALTLVLRRRR